MLPLIAAEPPVGTRPLGLPKSAPPTAVFVVAAPVPRPY